MDRHVASLFGPDGDDYSDDDEEEQVPRSPFILTGLPPEVNSFLIRCFLLKFQRLNLHSLKKVISNIN